MDDQQLKTMLKTRDADAMEGHLERVGGGVVEFAKREIVDVEGVLRGVMEEG